MTRHYRQGGACGILFTPIACWYEPWWNGTSSSVKTKSEPLAVPSRLNNKRKTHLGNSNVKMSQEVQRTKLGRVGLVFDHNPSRLLRSEFHAGFHDASHFERSWAVNNSRWPLDTAVQIPDTADTAHNSNSRYNGDWQMRSSWMFFIKNILYNALYFIFIFQSD